MKGSQGRSALSEASVTTWESADSGRVMGILDRWTGGRENLIPVLLEIQKELGFLPAAAIVETAARLGVPENEVWGVATFYNEFRFIPKGKVHIKVCLGTACHVKGGQIVMQAFERRLGIVEGQVTSDRQFSLERVGCVGCCGMAPVAVVNEEVYGGMSPMKVEGIVLRTLGGRGGE